MDHYTVYLKADEEIDGLPDEFDSYRLAPNLFLVRSSATQSRLYHDIKKQVEPTQLFVGKLSKNPKFKGMTEGSLKWVREGGD